MLSGGRQKGEEGGKAGVEWCQQVASGQQKSDVKWGALEGGGGGKGRSGCQQVAAGQQRSDVKWGASEGGGGGQGRSGCRQVAAGQQKSVGGVSRGGGEVGVGISR